MSEQTPAPREAKITMTEAILWGVAGLAVLIYVIAYAVIGNAGYDEDTTTPAGWMSFAGMIAGLTIIPAIILTGLRELLNARR